MKPLTLRCKKHRLSPKPPARTINIKNCSRHEIATNEDGQLHRQFGRGDWRRAGFRSLHFPAGGLGPPPSAPSCLHLRRTCDADPLCADGLLQLFLADAAEAPNPAVARGE